MRKITIAKRDLAIKEKVKCIYQKTATPFGISARIDSKKNFDKRAYIIIFKDK